MQKSFRKKIQFGLGFLCCLLAISFYSSQGNAKEPYKFKSFNLKTLNGQKKTLADFKNKVTLVGFFFPKCEFCKVSIPQVQKMYEQYKDKGLSVVWINVVPQEVKMIPKWQEDNNITAPVLVGASEESLMRDYNLKATPTHYLLDEKGEILLNQNGYRPGDEKVLEAKIVAALNITP